MNIIHPWPKGPPGPIGMPYDHENMKQYKCETCQAVYYNRHDYTEHLLVSPLTMYDKAKMIPFKLEK